MTGAADHLERTRVLVTGAQGCIGRVLCERLRAVGASVHGTRRRPAKNRGGAPADVRWWDVDLTERRATARVLDELRPEVIFHLAGVPLGSRKLEMVRATFDGNLATTINLLTAAAELGVGRVVLAGSLEEPEVGDPEAVASSPYAASKWAASIYGRMFHTLYGTPVTTARIFMVYGPQYGQLQKLVPHVILSLLHGEAPALGPGTRPVDWIYVDDVVDGLIALGSAPGVEGQRVDLGSGEAATVRWVVERLYELMEKGEGPHFGVLPERPFEQVRVADVEATRSALNWVPAVSLGEGLRRTVTWYRERLADGSIEWPAVAAVPS